jgi:hypothetical protein
VNSIIALIFGYISSCVSREVRIMAWGATESGVELTTVTCLGVKNAEAPADHNERLS